MRKINQFRQALTESKHRKHMRKSGKRWVVRGITMLTLGLTMAQPLVTVASAVDTLPPAADTKAAAESAQEEPVAAESDASDKSSEAAAKEDKSEEAAPAAEAESDPAAPAEEAFQTPKEQVTDAPAYAPEPSAPKALGPAQGLDDLSVDIGGEKTYDATDGFPTRIDHFFNVSFNWNLSMPMSMTDFEYLEGSQWKNGLPTNVGTYRVRLTSRMRTHIQSDMRDIYGDAWADEKFEGTYTIHQLVASIRATGGSRVWDGTRGTVDQYVPINKILDVDFNLSLNDINYQQVGVHDLSSGDWYAQIPPGVGTYRIRVNFATQLGIQRRLADLYGENVMLQLPSITDHDLFTVEEAPGFEKLGMSIGGRKTYDGSVSFPTTAADFFKVADLDAWGDLPTPEGEWWFEYKSKGTDSWVTDSWLTGGLPTAAGDYDVRVRDLYRSVITRAMEKKYGAALPDSAFEGSYTIDPLSVDLTVGGGSKIYDATAPSPAELLSTLEVADVDLGITKADFEYRLADTDDAWIAGAPINAGRYQVRLSEAKKSAIDVLIAEKLNGNVQVGAVYPGEYTIESKQLNLTVTGGNKQYDGTAVMPEQLIEQSPELEGELNITKDDFEFTIADEGNWTKGTPSAAGRYEIRLTESAQNRIVDQFDLNYGSNHSLSIVDTAEYEITLKTDFDQLSFSVGGAKVYNGENTLPDDFFKTSPNWMFDQPQNEDDYQYRAKGETEWQDGTPIEVGEYEVQVKPLRRQAIQDDIKAAYGETLPDSDFVGDYTIKQRLFLSLNIGGSREYDKTALKPADFVTQSEDLDLDFGFTEEDFRYQILGTDEWSDSNDEWHPGTPTLADRYRLTLTEEKQLSINVAIQNAYGPGHPWQIARGPFEITTPKAFNKLAISIGGEKVFDGADSLPADFFSPSPESWDFGTPTDADYEYRRANADSETDWTPGTPIEPGEYSVRVNEETRQAIQEKIEEEYGARLPLNNFEGDYTIHERVLSLSIGGTKVYDKTFDLPNDFVQQSSQLDLDLALENSDYEYKLEDGETWAQGVPFYAGQYDIRIHAGKQSLIQAGIYDKYGEYISEESFSGKYEITPSPDFEGLALAIDGEKPYDQSTQLNSTPIHYTGAWRYEFALKEADFQYRLLGETSGWIDGTPLLVGKYELRLRPEIRQGTQNVILGDYGQTLPDWMFSGTYEITPSIHYDGLAMVIDGEKEYDQSDFLPLELVQLEGQWDSEVHLGAGDVEHRAAGASDDDWQAGAPTKVGEYDLRVNATKQAQIQQEVKEMHGAGLPDWMFSGQYRIVPHADLDDITLKIGGKKQVDGTSDQPTDFVISTGGLEVTPDVASYQHRIQGEEKWFDGLPTAIGQYDVRFSPDKQQSLQDHLTELYGAGIPAEWFTGEYTIYGVANPYLTLPTSKVYDGTDQLPKIAQEHDLGIEIGKEHLIYTPKTAPGLPSSRLLTDDGGIKGAPTEPGVYNLALQQEYIDRLEAMYPDRDLSDMYQTTYTIEADDEKEPSEPGGGGTDPDTGGGGTTDPDTGGGGSTGPDTGGSSSTGPDTGGSSSTGTNQGTNTGANPGGSVVRPIPVNNPTTAVNPTTTHREGTLPQTGEQQKPWLILLGLSLLGMLGLGGWYKKRQRMG
ncbi:MBG domain-containing protein [Lacticaseibacillus jixianensis]|uniref:MBG domain-containing protein n=1 Tax=Lacticaseibacillus jixianensis TaxID=2486012 RepID=A0ABW4B4U0_9LACO|nr:MBG domain-containing protein [Lacticaseibacillus jixianensis]